MTVILLILKIIGIVLSFLIGLLVLLILAAVFYPVGYRIAGNFEDKKEIHFRFHWLFYLICFRFWMVQDEQRAVLYILGIPKQIFPAVEKKEKHHTLSRTMQITSVSEEEPTVLSENDDGVPDRTAASERNKTDFSKQSSLLGRFLKKIKRIFQKIKHFFRVLPDKMKAVYSNFAEWKEIITDEANKASVKLIWGEIKYLAFHYKPRRLKANICYGLGDPALTGKSLAILSMIPFLYRKKVQIVPDFETEKLFVKGNMDVRGHIRLFHLFRSGLHIWKDDNSRKFIRKLRQ